MVPRVVAAPSQVEPAERDPQAWSAPGGKVVPLPVRGGKAGEKLELTEDELVPVLQLFFM